jgi:xylulokinase
MDGFTGRALDPIRFIGGGAASEVWCQIMADVLGRRVDQTENPLQANVRGAAAIALVATGRATFEDQASRVRIGRTYTPKSEHRRVYDRAFRTFREIYRRNRPIYRQLQGAGD